MRDRAELVGDYRKADVDLRWEAKYDPRALFSYSGDRVTIEITIR